MTTLFDTSANATLVNWCKVLQVYIGSYVIQIFCMWSGKCTGGSRGSDPPWKNSNFLNLHNKITLKISIYAWLNKMDMEKLDNICIDNWIFGRPQSTVMKTMNTINWLLKPAFNDINIPNQKITDTNRYHCTQMIISSYNFP